MVLGLETCVGSTLPLYKYSETEGLPFFFFFPFFGGSLPFAAGVSHHG